MDERHRNLDVVGTLADVIRGNCCSELGVNRPVDEQTARRHAEVVWSQLNQRSLEDYPHQAESLGVRFYLVRGFGPDRVEANVWDGSRWRRVSEVRLTPSLAAAD